VVPNKRFNVGRKTVLATRGVRQLTHSHTEGIIDVARLFGLQSNKAGKNVGLSKPEQDSLTNRATASRPAGDSAKSEKIRVGRSRCAGALCSRQ